MLKWHKQGPAFTAPVQLPDGTPASVVLLGAAANPRALALVVPGPDGKPVSEYFPDAASRLTPYDLIQIYCMQERCFGTHGFHPPEGGGA
jgi:hypothetical protein